MGKKLENKLEYYYDSHPTEEDLMGETAIHASLVQYLILVLKWLFRGQACAIYDNLNFYQTQNPHEYPLAPDIAVIKGVDYQYVTSWKIGKTGPAPQVILEIASKETWEKDINEKPIRYATIGAEEYFVYDPNDPPNWKDTHKRLIGWRLNKARREAIEIPPDPEGHLWSDHLDSFLVPDIMYLRLYDVNNQQRLTGEEALAQKLRSLGVNPDEL